MLKRGSGARRIAIWSREPDGRNRRVAISGMGGLQTLIEAGFGADTWRDAAHEAG